MFQTKVIWISSCVVLLMGCQPTAMTPQPVAKKAIAKVDAIPAHKWEQGVKVPDDMPLIAMYTPLNQHLGAPNGAVLAQQDGWHYLASCDRKSVDDVIGRIAKEGKQRARLAKGPLATSKILADRLSSAKFAYQQAQKTCGFDYSRQISQLKKAERQAMDNMFELEARPTAEPNIAGVMSVIGGVAAISNAVNGENRTPPPGHGSQAPCMRGAAVTARGGHRVCQ